MGLMASGSSVELDAALQTLLAPSGGVTQRGGQRFAFQIDGPRITRVPLSDKIRPGMGWFWWTESPQTDIMTYPHHGHLHLEVSRDVLDGTGESVHRLAKALGMVATSASFMSLYASLLAMVQPRPAE